MDELVPDPDVELPAVLQMQLAALDARQETTLHLLVAERAEFKQRFEELMRRRRGARPVKGIEPALTAEVGRRRLHLSTGTEEMSKLKASLRELGAEAQES